MERFVSVSQQMRAGEEKKDGGWWWGIGGSFQQSKSCSGEIRCALRSTRGEVRVKMIKRNVH